MLLLSREQLHIEAYWPPQRRAQRNDHDLDEIMKPALPVRDPQILETTPNLPCELQRRVLDAWLESILQKTAKQNCNVKQSQCDSPALYRLS